MFFRLSAGCRLASWPTSRTRTYTYLTVRRDVKRRCNSFGSSLDLTTCRDVVSRCQNLRLFAFDRRHETVRLKRFGCKIPAGLKKYNSRRPQEKTNSQNVLRQTQYSSRCFNPCLSVRNTSCHAGRLDSIVLIDLRRVAADLWQSNEIT